jgi:hypothetical protein
MAIKAIAFRPAVRPDRNNLGARQLVCHWQRDASGQLVCHWTLADAVRSTDRVVPFKPRRKPVRRVGV